MSAPAVACPCSPLTAPARGGDDDDVVVVVVAPALPRLDVVGLRVDGSSSSVPAQREMERERACVCVCVCGGGHRCKRL